MASYEGVPSSRSPPRTFGHRQPYTPQLRRVPEPQTAQQSQTPPTALGRGNLEQLRRDVFLAAAAADALVRTHNSIFAGILRRLAL